MVHTLREITNICRLCLCEELDILVPAKNVFDSLLTSEDVERFTSIQILADDNVPYVICTDCRNGLRKSAAFRKSCVRNDRIYQQMFSQFIAETRHETDRKLLPAIVHRKSEDDFDECEHEFLNEIENVNCDDNGLILASTEQYISCDEELIELDNRHDASDTVLVTPAAVNVRAGRSKKLIRPKANKAGKRSKTLRLTKQADTPKAYSQEQSFVLDWPYLTKQLCDLCGQMVTNLKRHLLSHTKEAMYACPHCSMKMTDGSNLVRHINAVHMKTIVKTCDACGQGFTHYNTYNSHMRTKHGIGEKFKCKLCPKIFNHKGSLREHISRMHTYESKYECKLCSKRFKTRRALNIHGRVHSDNQPYACSYCPKRFKSGYARNTHQLTHTGITFSCELCRKSYRYKSLLNIHMRKHHPEAVIKSENADEGGGVDEGIV
ncbi:zinc finger protein 615-like [Anopheles merus]|uniref:zinc finger protein 615-like n=1 Tax=Anopheles merus TaxID=30066 RepID=UPI001BE4C323|nr:zinc finger protein 615-like [Anopheles merus]XP_041786240.1 zinc finger protein 615-like [Anopheles merus]